MSGQTYFRAGLISILALAVVGSTLALSSSDRRLALFDPLIDIEYLLSSEYVEELDYERIQRGAIDGMLATLNDPYTVYVPAVERESFEKELTGEYVGIGAQILIVDGWLTIVTPLDDSPALVAGLMADDRVTEIEGRSTYGMSTGECIELLQGEPGTDVHIIVERGSDRIPITITRDRIKTKSVKGYHRTIENGGSSWDYVIDADRRIAYIRLSQFTPACAKEIADALDSVGARDGDLGGLVLDLRGNPGGSLEEAIRITDLFIDEGVIVSTKGRAFPEEVRRATRRGTMPEFPMAVLINGQSASASEILAGALVDHERAIALGTRTFGKGSVQTVKTFGREELSELKFTTQRYYLPSGRSIQRLDESTEWGVDPTPGFYVPVSRDELIEAFRIRRDEEVIRNGDDDSESKWGDVDWVLEKLHDEQLAAAVRAVQIRIDTGLWEPTGDEGITGNELTLVELGDMRTRRERVLRELTRVDRRIAQLETVSDGDAIGQIDLWADDVSVEGGTLIVYDAENNVVAEFKVTGADLERWLIDADIEPIEDTDRE